MPQSVLLKEVLSTQYLNLLRCPLCHSPMELIHKKSLICHGNHCFDLAKQGYVNLLSHGVKTKYNKHLFEARKQLTQSGFFEPLTEAISQLILACSLQAQQGQELRILDAGCGEGSHLADIQQKLAQSLGKEPYSVGMDLAKEGIQMAARDYTTGFWCVADLAQCPFGEEQFDVILNILSPANYSEFARILRDDGLVIKVVPEKDYLKELREIFFAQTDKQDYSNKQTVELFQNHLELFQTVPLHYSLLLEQPLLSSLVQMTPLAWGASEAQIQEALNLKSLNITVALTILLGKKRGK